mmetsp:Transcript_23262/g.57756  ORF Transcript_23262/g.57756 Transcript_23262/m.57756 type:complete len:100 (+) Transcript_23262:81-380(+)
MSRFSVLLALAAILALFGAQSTTCACEQVTSGTCPNIIVTNVNPPTPQCRSNEVPCSGCNCVEGGSLTCDVVPTTGYSFTGQGNFCTLSDKVSVLCPPL